MSLFHWEINDLLNNLFNERFDMMILALMTFHILFNFTNFGKNGLFAGRLAIFLLSLVEIDVLDALFAFFAILRFWSIKYDLKKVSKKEYLRGQKSVLEVTVVASS